LTIFQRFSIHDTILTGALSLMTNHLAGGIAQTGHTWVIRWDPGAGEMTLSLIHTGDIFISLGTADDARGKHHSHEQNSKSFQMLCLHQSNQKKR